MVLPFIQAIELIPGWLQPEEAVFLYQLARDWPGRGRVVELGSYQGRSTVCLAAGMKERVDSLVPLLAIDTHTGSPEHQPGNPYFDPSTIDNRTGLINTYGLLAANLRRFGLEGIVNVWPMTSQAAALEFSGTIRLMFIDGDHGIEAVSRDVATWSEFLEPGGCLVLHDVGTGWPGPAAAANALIASCRFRAVTKVGSALALMKT